ncbi:MAG: hypothetical protein ACI36Z_07270 [Alloprevotella sp.]
MRQTIGNIVASPALRPMSLIVVRYGSVAASDDTTKTKTSSFGANKALLH